MISPLLLLILFIISLHALIFNPSLMKKVFALNILNSAIVLLFITQGASLGSRAPFTTESPEQMVDPVVQALMLTAIVIGVCVTSFSLALVVHLHSRYGSFDYRHIRKGIANDR
ncbi:MAG: cation:proton antiporter subunit C [Sphaerochaetaceae bacterium]|nr:cation:proton antiporter subunit C [Sphaerochaetaceae bacterium]